MRPVAYTYCRQKMTENVALCNSPINIHNHNILTEIPKIYTALHLFGRIREQAVLDLVSAVVEEGLHYAEFVIVWDTRLVCPYTRGILISLILRFAILAASLKFGTIIFTFSVFLLIINFKTLYAIIKTLLFFVNKVFLFRKKV